MSAQPAASRIDAIALVGPTASGKTALALTLADRFGGAIINTDAFIGDNTIINTGAIVEHHTQIGANCHVATGATICGDVTVGDGTHVGAGATVIQGIKIGAKCIIGAGAVVITDVPDGHTAVGVPAKIRPNKA